MAEADGNRTRLTGMPGHYGFEDRARHQTRNASAAQSSGGAHARVSAEWEVDTPGQDVAGGRWTGGSQAVNRLVAVAAPAHRSRQARPWPGRDVLAQRPPGAAPGRGGQGRR